MRTDPRVSRAGGGEGREVSAGTPPAKARPVALGRCPCGLTRGLCQAGTCCHCDAFTRECGRLSELGLRAGSSRPPAAKCRGFCPPSQSFQNVPQRKALSPSPRLFSQPHPHFLLPQGKTNRYQTSGLEGAVVSAKPPPGVPPLPPGPCLCPAVLLLTGVDGVVSDSRSCSHRHWRFDLGTCGTLPGVDGSSERSSTHPSTCPENSTLCARFPGRLKVIEKHRWIRVFFSHTRGDPVGQWPPLSLSLFPPGFHNWISRAFSWS